MLSIAGLGVVKLALVCIGLPLALLSVALEWASDAAAEAARRVQRLIDSIG